MVFEQPGKLTFDEPHIGASTPIGSANAPSRANFSTKKFLQKYKLGPLVAANFFQVKN